MRPFIFFIFLLSLALTACGGPERLVIPDSNSDLNVDPNITNNEPAFIIAITFDQSNPFPATVGSRQALSLNVLLSDGTFIENVTDSFATPNRALRGDVLWKSENPERVDVDKAGEINLLQAGESRVTATLLGQKRTLILQAKAVSQVAVGETPFLVSLGFTQDQYDLPVGGSLSLKLDASFSDGENLDDKSVSEVVEAFDCFPVFSGSPANVLTVTSNGLVTAVGSGLGQVTVTCGDLSDTAVIKVGNIQTSCPLGTTSTGGDFVKSLRLSPATLLVGANQPLKAQVELNSRTIADAGTVFSVGNDLCDLTWESSNPSVVAIEAGKMKAVGYGKATLAVRFQNVSASVEITVLMATDSPADPSQRYLGTDDVLTSAFGEGSGYGSHLFPSIVHGAPAGGTHVVSFGFGGVLTIELNGFITVDGPGPDFTVFENPMSDASGAFSERARVSVSEDGIDYVPFDCDAFDPARMFEGCAGIHGVNTLASALDPLVSGGDVYDLLDIGVGEVRFIRIEDMKTCVNGDPTYPLCNIPGKKGFDLDAIAILNGVSE